MIPHRYVFVAGLHRSGTSLIARILGSHPEVGAINGAPVPENEGCYLQGAIPHTARHGIPGHFATDPAQHLVEGCALDTLDTRLRLEADWAPWYPPDTAWRVEKSPVNLTRMRLLQSLYPLAHFVVVTRHPAFVDQAMRKWGIAAADDFPAHWRAAHDLVMEDIRYLHAAMVVRYEDLVSDPGRMAASLFRFLNLEPDGARVEPVADGNARYRHDVAADAPGYARLGYAKGGGVVPIAPLVQHPLRRIREATLEILDQPSLSSSPSLSGPSP